ncbi:EamA family transporter [Panacibacter ginsenosidivorans]|uniref:EamA family transporter n=1 Tax=Panacibacter ginsenosidivorans TaxID=1813871 RepID=A0A5B8VEP8_9BACT|nr:EamA family transporter [Panacibacter ginsenosidivorans]QEC69890.1 EamA family transporter [Panacibacter ginsenosidivorans]
MKLAIIRLHIAVFLWGFTGILGRLISLNEGWLVWWRMLITAIALWLYFFFSKQIQRISLRDFLKIGSIGTILSIHWLLFYGSIKYSNVSIALTCLATTGLLSAIIEPLFFRRRINITEILLGSFALAGIIIIYFSNLQFSIGIYIGLLSSLATVVVSVLNKKIVSGYTPQSITLYQLTGGFVGLTILMPFYDLLFHSDIQYPQKLDWLWLLILGIFCTVLTFLLYIKALRHLSAFTINLTLTLEPIYGIILAFAVFSENKYLSNYFYIGFALILIAVLLQMRRLVKEKRAIMPFE